MAYEFIQYRKDKIKKKHPTIPGFKKGIGAMSIKPQAQKIATNPTPTIAIKNSPVAASNPPASPSFMPPHFKTKGKVNKNIVGAIAGSAILLATGFVIYFAMNASGNNALPPLGTRANTDIPSDSIDLANSAIAPTAPAARGEATILPTIGPSQQPRPATPSATLDTDEDSEAETIVNEQDNTNLASEEAELDTSDFDVSSVSPTPITQLPNSSTYQYFVMISIVAASIIVTALFL